MFVDEEIIQTCPNKFGSHLNRHLMLRHENGNGERRNWPAKREEKAYDR